MKRNQSPFFNRNRMVKFEQKRQTSLRNYRVRSGNGTILRFGLTIRPRPANVGVNDKLQHLAFLAFGIDPYLRNDYPDITYYVHTHVLRLHTLYDGSMKSSSTSLSRYQDWHELTLETRTFPVAVPS